MLQFERRLEERFPQWFRGRRAALARPLIRTIGRWSKFDHIDQFLAETSHLRDFDFVSASLDFVQARYLLDAAELQRIRAAAGC